MRKQRFETLLFLPKISLSSYSRGRENKRKKKRSEEKRSVYLLNLDEGVLVCGFLF